MQIKKVHSKTHAAVKFQVIRMKRSHKAGYIRRPNALDFLRAH